MRAPVTISAPSRLHFGLFSAGVSSLDSRHQPAEFNGGSKLVADTGNSRLFGGIGLMVDSPRTIINASAADRLEISGPAAKTCWHAVDAIWHHLQSTKCLAEQFRDQCSRVVDELPIQIEIESAPPRHCGLGSGTQLAFCTAAAVLEFFGAPFLGPQELANTLRRGKRSAIGTFGFFEGGLLVDRGKQLQDPISPLDFRTDFPEHWPVVIVMLRGEQGFSGADEKLAFDKLPAVTKSQREQMIGLVRDRLIPGVLQQDYERFAAAVYEYGRHSGMMFETVQGGPYNGSAVTELVDFIRNAGITAVGQTSWGPSVFAIEPDEHRSEELITQLKNKFGARIDIIDTHADNCGFQSSKQPTTLVNSQTRI